MTYCTFHESYGNNGLEEKMWKTKYENYKKKHEDNKKR